MSTTADAAISSIAAAIGEPARAQMLYRLADGRARTSTELAVVADVSPSTASVHLQRLKAERLVRVLAQGKCRYYSLASADVAAALEALSVLAGAPTRDVRARRRRSVFVPRGPATTTSPARSASSSTIGSSRSTGSARRAEPRGLRPDEAGADALERAGVDVDRCANAPAPFAFACLDWSERRPHLGGALGAALLDLALTHRWVEQDLDSRSLEVTARGRREMRARFGLHPS